MIKKKKKNSLKITNGTLDIMKSYSCLVPALKPFPLPCLYPIPDPPVAPEGATYIFKTFLCFFMSSHACFS